MPRSPPPRRCNKRKRYKTSNAPSIADYFGKRRMQTIREESIQEETWLGTQEDQDDFVELSDEFLRSTSKKRRQEDDDITCGVQADSSLLDNTGGSSMASWLGTEEDKDDFVRMSDLYISSTQLSKEDDIKNEQAGAE